MSSFEALGADPSRLDVLQIEPWIEAGFESHAAWLDSRHTEIFESDEGAAALRAALARHVAREKTLRRVTDRYNTQLWARLLEQPDRQF